MGCSKKAVRSFYYAQGKGSEPEKQDPSGIQKKTMPLLKCKCDARILVLPDLKAMNKAIEKHVAEHRKTIKSKTKPKTNDDLRQFLIKQLFDLSSARSKRIKNHLEKNVT